MIWVWSWSLTYGVEIVKDFVNSDQLVVELIVGCGVRQEGVAVCDEKIKDLYHLYTVMIPWYGR